VIVGLPNDEKLTGPYLFCNRLSNELSKSITVRNCGEKDCTKRRCDICLNVISGKCGIKGVKNVLRLDGVYFDYREDYFNKNSPIISSLRKNDAIVYQSHYSRLLCNRYLGEANKTSTIIYNGYDPLKFKPKFPSDFGCEVLFLASSLWRPFKRLRDTIISFVLADIANSILFIAGKIDRSGLTAKEIRSYSKLKNIRFLGQLTEYKLMEYVSACTALIHLSWLDNCPNSVVEALCAKKPVICSNATGTKEIVGKCGGLVLSIDEVYDFRPCNVDKPPAIDRNKVADALRYCVNNVIEVDNTCVDIRNVAKKYVTFFNKVLKNGKRI